MIVTLCFEEIKEVEEMRRALEAFEEGAKKGTSSVNVDGRMIDVASAERCMKILERAQAIAVMNNKKKEALKNPDTLEERLRAAIDKI